LSNLLKGLLSILVSAKAEMDFDYF